MGKGKNWDLQFDALNDRRRKKRQQFIQFYLATKAANKLNRKSISTDLCVGVPCYLWALANCYYFFQVAGRFVATSRNLGQNLLACLTCLIMHFNVY